MRAWLFMLAGLIVWAVHFMGVYAIASVAAVVGQADGPLALWLIGVLTLFCATADALILAAAMRQGRRAADGLERLICSLAGLAAAISIVAVLWQGLPALIGH